MKLSFRPTWIRVTTPDGGEPPGCFDLYERAGGQTTLISIGPQGGSGSYDVVAYLTPFLPTPAGFTSGPESRSSPRTTTAPGVRRMCICAPAIRRCSCRSVRLAPTRPASRISAARQRTGRGSSSRAPITSRRTTSTMSMTSTCGREARRAWCPTSATRTAHGCSTTSRTTGPDFCSRPTPVSCHPTQTTPRTCTWPPLQPATRAPWVPVPAVCRSSPPTPAVAPQTASTGHRFHSAPARPRPRPPET